MERDPSSPSKKPKPSSFAATHNVNEQTLSTFSSSIQITSNDLLNPIHPQPRPRTDHLIESIQENPSREVIPLSNSFHHTYRRLFELLDSKKSLPPSLLLMV